MALPTRATSDQACRRLRAFLDRAVNTVGTDLQLVHGSAALSVDHEELEGATGAPNGVDGLLARSRQQRLLVGPVRRAPTPPPVPAAAWINTPARRRPH